MGQRNTPQNPVLKRQLSRTRRTAVSVTVVHTCQIWLLSGKLSFSSLVLTGLICMVYIVHVPNSGNLYISKLFRFLLMHVVVG